MEDKVVNSRISDILNLFAQIIVMQIQALYDEYEEQEIHDIENDYKENYKNLIDKSANGIDICSKIKDFILLEVDPYGLSTKESNIKCDIENIFNDFSRNLSVESMFMRDKWKKEQVGELEETITFLNETIKKLRSNNNILERDLENTSKKFEDVRLELDKLLNTYNEIIKKNKSLLNELEKDKEKLKKEEEKNNKLSKDNRNLSVEIQNFKNQNENLVFEKTALKEEVLMLKTKVKTGTDSISTEKIQKLNSEIEHLKNGINLLKSQNKEKDNSMRRILNEKDKLSNEYRNAVNKNNEIKKEYDELKLQLNSKDKEIDKLKKQIIVSSKVVNKPKMSAEEAKQKFSKMYREIFEKLKKIAFTTKVIQGQNIRELANEINKMAGRFGNLHSSDEVKQLLSEFILKLCNLHRLLENNSKESGLDEYIDLLRKLEAKL